MGGNSASHVSGEDERGGISFVKGIRLSDRVINRMKHSSKLQSPHHSSESQTPPVVAIPPLPQGVLPTAPLVENAPVKLLPPPPVKFHSLPPTSVEPKAPSSLEEPKTPDSSLAPLPSTPPPRVDPPVVLEVLPPPPAAEQILQPPVEPFIPPVAQTTPQIPEPVAEPVFIQSPVASSPASVALPETLGHPCEPVKPAPAVTIEPLESAPPPPPSATLPPCFESPLMEPVLPAEAVIPPPQAEATLVVSSAVAEEAPPAVELTPPPLPEHVAALPPAPEPCLGETSPPCHCEDQLVAPTEPPLELVTPSPPDLAPPPDDVEDEEVPVVATVPPPAAALAVPPVIVEEELRQKIKAELQRGLEDEIKQKRDELQRQLEVMRALAQAEAQAAAQAQVDEQVKNTLEAEKEAHTEKLTESIAKARTKTEDERLMAQLYRMELKAHHLEEKEKELKTRDVLYREHVTKLEAKCSEFYKVTAESFQKGKEETHKRFTHFDIQPVCGDLQGQILKCYKENAGKTLSCSSIASAYMQCVDNAKKNKLSTGG